MTPFTSILTHPGSAHKDEFLACCVLLATFPVPIARREPTPGDLADPATAVVDVGHTHDLARNNFDHHQFDDTQPPTCALSLVLQSLGLYADARTAFEWLEPAEWFDCRGPIETARHLGVERQVINQLNSPIDGALLRRFASIRHLDTGEPLWEIMRLVGTDLLGHLRTLRARLAFIAEHAELWTLDELSPCADATLPPIAVFLPRTTPLPPDPSSGIAHYIQEQGLDERVAAIIAPDRRGNGYGLSRHRDDPRLDFTRIAKEPDVHFAHQRGFVAKTGATDPQRLHELLLLAVR